MPPGFAETRFSLRIGREVRLRFPCSSESPYDDHSPFAVSPECFYLHIDGEQRGPYTVAQIDHLLNSGLIREETTYWREGMEQWHPVTNLVHLRKPVRSWWKPGLILALAVVILLFGRLFGPVTLEGWRETAQYDFTPIAAYWRARDAVRHQGAPPEAVIVFGGYKMTKVEMTDRGAKVWLPAELSGLPSGARPAAWDVTLAYDAKARRWTALSVQELTR
jgi:hypothetical protein